MQRDQRRGATIVETAIVLPVFLLVTLGVIEFGRGMMASQLVTHAARQGARVAIYEGSSNAEVAQEVRDFLTQAANVGSGDIGVTITVTPAPGNPDPGNLLTNAGRRDLCTVRVEVPFDAVSYIPGDYLAGRNLVSESAMRHE